MKCYGVQNSKTEWRSGIGVMSYCAPNHYFFSVFHTRKKKTSIFFLLCPPTVSRSYYELSPEVENSHVTVLFCPSYQSKMAKVKSNRL